jgi:hypothetical protein
MSIEIINIDDLLGDPKKVQLGGKIYTLPAQIPVPFYLRMKQVQKKREEESDENKKDEDIVEYLYNEALELFQINHPDITELPLTVPQLLQLVARIYNPELFENKDEENKEQAPLTQVTLDPGNSNTETSPEPVTQ